MSRAFPAPSARDFVPSAPEGLEGLEGLGLGKLHDTGGIQDQTEIEW